MPSACAATTTMRRPGERPCTPASRAAPRASPDARQVAARKDRVALDRAGRDDDPPGVHEVQQSLAAIGTSGPW